MPEPGQRCSHIDFDNPEPCLWSAWQHLLPENRTCLAAMRSGRAFYKALKGHKCFSEYIWKEEWAKVIGYEQLFYLLQGLYDYADERFILIE